VEISGSFRYLVLNGRLPLEDESVGFDQNNSRAFGILSGEAAEKVADFYRAADDLMMRRIEEETGSEPFRNASDLDPRSALSLDGVRAGRTSVCCTASRTFMGKISS